MKTVDAHRAPSVPAKEGQAFEVPPAGGQRVKHSYRVVHRPALSQAYILPLTYHHSVNGLTGKF